MTIEQLDEDRGVINKVVKKVFEPTKKVFNDLNNDGVVDKKDKSMAAKVLATGKKIMRK